MFLLLPFLLSPFSSESHYYQLPELCALFIFHITNVCCLLCLGYIIQCNTRSTNQTSPAICCINPIHLPFSCNLLCICTTNRMGDGKVKKGSCRFAILLLKRQPPLKGIFYLIITWQNYCSMFLSLRTVSCLLPEAGFSQGQELPMLSLHRSAEELVFS